MTNAEPEACEVIKIANPIDVKALIKINQFRGQYKSKFELFFGQSDKHFRYKAYDNFMVDPNEIKFRATVEHENKKEMQVALVGNNKITLMEVHSGNSIVSGRNNIHNEDYINALMAKTEYFVDAEENAGFTLVNYNETSEAITDNVSLRFNPDYKFNKALCYIGGVKTVLDVKNNTLDITLGVGEGVFVIPYCG